MHFFEKVLGGTWYIKCPSLHLQFDDVLPGVDEPRVGDDSEFLDFAGQKDRGGGQQERVDGAQGVDGVEALEVDGGGRDHLLPKFKLFA